MDRDQTSTLAVLSGPTLFVSMSKLVIDVSIYMHQMTSADNILNAFFR